MINWQDKYVKLAVLQLLLSGEIAEGARNKELVGYLFALGWLCCTPAAKFPALTPSGREKLRSTAEKHWPEIEERLRFFRSTGCEISLRNLQRAERNRRPVPVLPRRIHWKTYAAVKGAHSKQKELKSTIVGGSRLTTDEILRFRPNRGLILKTGTGIEIACDSLAAVAGEGMLTERAFLSRLGVSGTMPGKMITIENLGAFIDFPEKDDLLLVYQPGWNTDLSTRFVSLFPSDIPWLHFGDLDPEGLTIYNHLRRKSPSREITHFIPDFWHEYLEEHAQKTCDWSAHTPFSNPLLINLSNTGRWLEQEAIVLDRRILVEINLQAGSRHPA